MEQMEEVTAREAARILKVNLQFLYQLIWSGKIEGKKVKAPGRLRRQSWRRGARRGKCDAEEIHRHAHPSRACERSLGLTAYHPQLG